MKTYKIEVTETYSSVYYVNADSEDKAKVKDGWHVIKGYEVYVEDGKIIRGVKNDANGSMVPAYPYKWESAYNTWCKGTPTVSAFRGNSWELK